MSNTLIVPDWNPQEKIGRNGWAATQSGWSIGDENSTA